MNVTGATKNIDYIVHSVMADLKETDTKNFPYYLKWALDGYRELNLFSLPCIKTVCLPVSNILTIDLPDDYVKYTAIGIRLKNHIFLLGRNDDMLLRRDDDCEVPIETVVQKPDHFAGIFPYYYFFSGVFRNGQYVGEQYAQGGGWSRKGYYKIDEEMHRIQFSGMIPKTEIILEYKSTGLSCDGSVEVPNQAISALNAFVHWQRVEHDESLKGLRNYGMQVDRKERLWKIEFNKLKHYNLMFTVQEFLDAKWRTIKQTPKR